MVKALEPLTNRLSTQPSRDAILEAHARHESGQQAQTPSKLYPEILAIVYKRLAEEWGNCRVYNTLPVAVPQNRRGFVDGSETARRTF